MAILLALFFALVGWSKVAGPSGANWAIRLSHWGYPTGSRYVIGGVEILAGVALLVPQLRRPAAMTLIVVMAGALGTHLMHGEFVRVLPPLVLGGLSFGLYSWQPRASQKVEAGLG
jgi:putative oxidoreductase